MFHGFILTDEVFKRSQTHCVQNYLKFVSFILFLLVKLYRFLKNYKSSTTLHNYSKRLSF